MDTTLLPRAAFACCVIGGLSGAFASFMIAPGKRSFFKGLYARPKTDFTPLGWRLHRTSLFFGYLTVAIAVVFWLLPE